MSERWDDDDRRKPSFVEMAMPIICLVGMAVIIAWAVLD